ncbi:MAG: hypothetical protein U0175_39635 [Caldilineaceae bacterium]
MTNRFVDQAKSQYGALEKLLSRLPGVGGYMDKELRRDADYKLRQMIAENLSQPLHDLLSVQQKLLKEGGLLLLDECGTCVTRLQTLIDRVKTASYGYAGLFDAIKVREEQLDALHRFDVSLAASVEKLQTGVSALTEAVKSSEAKESLGTIIEQVTDLVDELTELFNKRNQAIIAPDLLTDSTYVPEVDPKLLKP